MSPLERARILLDDARLCFDGVLHDRVSAFLAGPAPEGDESLLSEAFDLLSEASLCIDGPLGYRIEGFLAKERAAQGVRLSVASQYAANQRAAAAMWPEHAAKLTAGVGLRYIDIVLATVSLQAAYDLGQTAILRSADRDVCTLLPEEQGDRVLELLDAVRHAALYAERDACREYNRLCREIDLALASPCQQPTTESV